MVLSDSVAGGAAALAGAEPATAEARVVAAAIRCIARWGLSKTTLDDIAREAGCSRATVYRLFPGGKPSLIETVCRREVVRLLLDVTTRLDAAPDVETMLFEAIHTAAAFVADNDALQMLVRHEPETLLPYLAFDRIDPLLDTATAFVSPYLARHLDPDHAAEVVEWGTRIVLSYMFTPNPTIDLTDEVEIHRLVSSYVLPGIVRASTPSSTDQKPGA
jgi:AcrR family transcriptional regulator